MQDLGFRVYGFGGYPKIEILSQYWTYMMLWLSSLLFTGKENGKATESLGNMFHNMSVCFFKVGKRDLEEWIPIIIPM